MGVTLGNAAVQLASDGYRVFPLRPRGKTPLWDHWQDRASTNGEEVATWWRGNPEANIGIATGRGLVVIDVDAAAAMGELEGQLGPLPPTKTARTAKGYHLYFAVGDVEVRNSAGKLAPGIDVRGDGGFVVAPPSVHPSGAIYAWDDDQPVAELPASWLTRMTAPTGRWIGPPPEVIPEGQRNTALTRMAGSLRRAGLSTDGIRDVLQRENANRCQPPLPAMEVDRIVASAQRWAPGGDIPVQPFPLHVLPPAVREYVEAAGVASGLPIEYLAASSLVAMAAAVGKSRALQVKRLHVQYPVIWLALVGPPASGKSPAIGWALAPMRAYDAGLEREAARQHAAYMADHDAWARLPQRARGEEPRPQREARLIAKDVTMEVFWDLLSDNPRGMLWDQDELASLLAGLNQYKPGGRGADRANLLSMWGSENIKSARKTGHQRLFVPSPVVSIIGGVQPSVLASLRGDHDGMVERFLLVYRDVPEARRWSFDDLPDAVYTAYDALLQELLVLPCVVGPSGIEPHILRFSPAAEMAWAYEFERHSEEMVGLPERLQGAWGKFDVYALRFALILHVARTLDQPAFADEVGEQAVRDGWTLVDFFKGQVRRAHSAMSRTSVDTGAGRLVAFVEREGGRTTVRDAVNHHVCGARTNEDLEPYVLRAVEQHELTREGNLLRRAASSVRHSESAAVTACTALDGPSVARVRWGAV